MDRLLLALPLYLAMLLAAAAGPSMSSAWLKIAVDQDECVLRSKAGVQENSFTTRFEVLGNSSIYGERGEYTALVRCAADMNMAYFVVAGPKGDVASRYMNAIRDRVSSSLARRPRREVGNRAVCNRKVQFPERGAQLDPTDRPG